MSLTLKQAQTIIEEAKNKALEQDCKMNTFSV